MRRAGIRTVMITGDNRLTAATIAAEAGVDDFVAEAKPEDKIRLIREEQAKGRLVAMTGDGTNDAPALAQADVGVAMNSGTAAAKEAANMVDLDSDPTKLVDVVAIGKQLLMTRGALTTFSIANDVSKYFAIIPAMFVGIYPQLDKLNIMRLSTPQSAILSAVIFNALIIIALVPLALKGVAYQATPAAEVLRSQPADLRRRRHHRAVHRHQAHRPARSTLLRVWTRDRRGIEEIRHGKDTRQQTSGPRSSAWCSSRVLCGLAYPLAITGVAQARLPRQANGSLVNVDGEAVGSSLVGQNFSDAEVLPPPALGGRRGRLRRQRLLRLQPRPLQPGAGRSRDSEPRDASATRTAWPPTPRVPVDAVTASASGLDPHISPAYAELQVARVAKERGMTEDAVRALVKKYTDGCLARRHGRAAGQRAALNLALDKAQKQITAVAPSQQPALLRGWPSVSRGEGQPPWLASSATECRMNGNDGR